MTETIAPADSQATESPRLAPRLVLSQHVRGTSLLDRIGRQRHIQDCVDQILAKVDPRPAAS
jgi:hypothetical protein